MLVLARGTFRDIRFLTATPDGTVYFIDTFDLMRVTPDGAVSVVAKSHWPWEVSGGAIAPNGDLWVLEFRLYEARVRNAGRVLNPSRY